MASREEWVGRTGLEWSRRGQALDLLLGPADAAGQQALSAVAGERIIDLGCGAGASIEALSTAVGPSGHVMGIDVSPDLLRQAQDRMSETDNIQIVEGDAQNYVFDQNFDALYSRFGSMFFDDPAAAFRNLASALKPGGRAVFVVWREPARNQWASVPMTFVVQGSAKPGSQPGPGPFAWADPRVFQPLLEGAGFKDVVHKTFEFLPEISEGDHPDPVARAVRFMMKIGPLAARLRGATETAKEEAAAFLQRRLTRHVHDDAVRLLASAWIIEARA
ncbi:MAG: class I SAM-dependent methyltransferase [Pseudomonadota bacterium]